MTERAQKKRKWGQKRTRKKKTALLNAIGKAHPWTYFGRCQYRPADRVHIRSRSGWLRSAGGSAGCAAGISASFLLALDDILINAFPPSVVCFMELFSNFFGTRKTTCCHDVHLRDAVSLADGSTRSCFYAHAVPCHYQYVVGKVGTHVSSRHVFTDTCTSKEKIAVQFD